ELMVRDHAGPDLRACVWHRVLPAGARQAGVRAAVTRPVRGYRLRLADHTATRSGPTERRPCELDFPLALCGRGVPGDRITSGAKAPGRLPQRVARKVAAQQLVFLEHPVDHQ